MKKTILMMLLLVSVFANAQKDVTKFLGIPVDGYKSEMRRKLIDKGFTYNAQYDYLEGEFNGQDVIVSIVTNKNKVWRIMVFDANPCGEASIKIRFNKLCEQFARNKKYVPTNFGEEDYTLSEDEDISYELLVHKKRYEASYYQLPDPEEMSQNLEFKQTIKDALLREYTQEQLDNPTQTEAENIERLQKKEIEKYYFDLMAKRHIWFMIREQYGKYYISMYYDNEYNRADGEDL